MIDKLNEELEVLESIFDGEGVLISKPTPVISLEIDSNSNNSSSNPADPQESSF